MTTRQDWSDALEEMERRQHADESVDTIAETGEPVNRKLVDEIICGLIGTLAVAGMLWLAICAGVYAARVLAMGR